jgi:chemotaxis protein CheD
MVNLGAKPTRMVAKLVGGASVLAIPEFNNTFRIGQRNIKCAETTLKTAKIPITGRATGGTVGRTIKFEIANGHVITRTLRQKEQRI